MRRRPLCLVMLLLVLGISVFYNYRKHKLDDYDGKRQTFVCELVELTGQEDSYTMLVQDVYSGTKKLCHKMKLYTDENTIMSEELHIGNLLRIEASVYSFSIPGNPGQFNEYEFYTQQGISYKGFVSRITVESTRRDEIKDCLYRLRCRAQKIIDSCCDSETAGIVSAMVLGDRSGLSEETKQLYQKNGIAHVLAISGLHISLIGVGLFFVLRRFIMPMQQAVFTTISLLLLYGIFTGFSISTQRAVTMMGCMLFARLAGRQYDALCALSFSAILQLVVHPFVLFQTGFLLSYGTVLGIVLFLEEFKSIKSGTWFLYEALWGSVGIQLVTLPILLFSYYEISPYSILANCLLIPLLGGVLFASIGGIILGGIGFAFGKFCFGFVHYFFSFINRVCMLFADFPYAGIVLGKPALWQISLYYVGMFIFGFLQRRNNSRKNLLILLAALTVLCFPIHRVMDLRITNLDVGQGDCACIRTKAGCMLVDGGSSDVAEVARYRIVPFLKSQGISRLEYIFITHSDGDHTNGIQEILDDPEHMGLGIGTVVFPKIRKEDESYIKLVKLCRKMGVNVSFMEKGDTIQWGEMVLTCLHPYASYEWKTENDYSLVLQIDYRQFRGLLTGDLEQEGERELYGRLSPVNYLKVGHHGSKGSSGEEFIQNITPDFAVLSAGKKNRYGHPSAEVIKRLREVGAEIYCTIEKGAVTVESDGYRSEMCCYKD